MRSAKVERLAKQKMAKAHTEIKWDQLRPEAVLKQYYRDQARQELPGVERTEAWKA